MIKLLIIDDHAMFRAGLRKVFGDERDIEVIDEAGDWRDGMAKLERHAVDVLLLDINLPDRSGLEVLDVIRVRFPALRTIVLSMYCEPQYAMRAMPIGRMRVCGQGHGSGRAGCSDPARGPRQQVCHPCHRGFDAGHDRRRDGFAA